MVTPIRSIAILRLGALGDVCLTVPLIRTLQHHLPHAKIVWIIGRAAYPFVHGLSGVEFIVIDKPKSLRDYWRCYRLLKPYYFDALLVPQATLRSNLLCPLINAKIKYGYGPLHSRDLQRWFVQKKVASYPEHMLDSFLRFAEPFGISEKIIAWDLPIAPEDWAWARNLLGGGASKWLAICPSASKKERNWLTERYVAVVEQLHNEWEFNVVLIGGNSADEKALAATIEKQLSMPVLNIVGKSSLKQLSAVLGTVDVLLSPDTGPVHIATAFQTPVVGLYAVAPPEKTGPYFSKNDVVNVFSKAVITLLARDPKRVDWHARVHSPEAMALISVEAVVAKLTVVFERQGFSLKPKLPA